VEGLPGFSFPQARVFESISQALLEQKIINGPFLQEKVYVGHNFQPLALDFAWARAKMFLKCPRHVSCCVDRFFPNLPNGQNWGNLIR
jgi:hypothetical protein